MGLAATMLLSLVALRFAPAGPPLPPTLAPTQPSTDALSVKAVCLGSLHSMALLRVGDRDYLVEPGWRSPDGRLAVDALSRDGMVLREDGVPRRLPVGPPLMSGATGPGSTTRVAPGAAGPHGAGTDPTAPDAAAHGPAAQDRAAQDPAAPDPAAQDRAAQDRVTVFAVAVDAGDLVQMIGRGTGLTLVAGPAVAGATTIQIEDQAAEAAMALLAAVHDARVSTSPDLPGAFVLSRHTLDDVVFDPVADPAARRTTVKMRPSRIGDVLRLVAVSGGVKLRFTSAIDGIMAVEMAHVRPLDALRLVAAAAGLDVRRTDTPGLFDVTPAAP